MDINIVIKKAFFYSLGISLISGFIFSISFLNSWFVSRITGFKTWMIPLISGMVTFIIGNIFYNKSKKVDKLKYEFITVAAHKLRTPLTRIKWAVDALDDKLISKKERKQLISHQAYLTKTEGLGIGLYLAKNIVEKHNGKIGVISKGEERGSEFWINLDKNKILVITIIHKKWCNIKEMKGIIVNKGKCRGIANILRKH